ncbi:ABC transporter ATP-binding protein [Actinomyces minihominis]|uniref:ABC transporter ATP-binding protein n=1 Tax=Actinomyces minihominis TaxID=2002838 RepID=UPI000C07FFFF|nr:ABC transporter ATP-binding protein [Actinomyces minihominis]
MKLPVANTRQIIRELSKLIRRRRGAFILILFLQITAATAAVGLPWILGDIIDNIRAGTTSQYVGTMVAISVLLVLIGAITGFYAEYHARVFGETIFAEMREELVETVTTLPLSTVEEAGTGDLLGRTTRDIEKVQFMVRQGVSAILVLVMAIVVTIVASVWKSPLLSVALLAAIIPTYFVVRWYLPRTIPAYKAQASAWARMSGAIVETIDNAETVDALGLEPLRNRRIDEAIREAWRLERYTAWQRVYLMVGLVFFVTLPIVLVVLLGAWFMPLGLVTAGQIASVAMYAYQLRGPIWNFTFWVDEMQFAQASLGRIFGVKLVEPDRVPTGEKPPNSHMEATDVTYAYTEGRNVLHGVDLNLVPGETLAIVGPSGAGKSTFGRMLAGIHPPTSGRVTVGGVDLVKLDEEELQKQVVLVSQEHHVFVGTLADNMRLAKADASDEEMRQALAAVGAMTWVEDLEDGLETRVGVAGYPLSPGRAQQLALARIVLMDPHTLVLDEATSLMDPTAARSLERSLGRVLDGRTVVAIAHRLYTAQDADRVAVMIDGNLAELGSHEELVDRGGEYASLWASWQKS